MAEPAIEAEVLLRHTLQCDRAALYTRWEAPMDPSALAHYRRFLEIRSTGRPVPYIIGEREFMSLSFVVDERVMIPRPETEVLVEFLIEQFGTSETRKRGNAEARTDRHVDERELVFVDVGTGSGCIAVSLAHYLPRSRVYATDISAAALDVAAQNARCHHVADRVVLLEGDLLSPLPRSLDGQVRVIASNPPYVPLGQAPTLAREIREFEPADAVFSPAEGTVMHSRLIEQAPRRLSGGGMLAMEVAAGQAQSVRDLVARDNRYSGTRVLTDLSGIERVVVAKRRQE